MSGPDEPTRARSRKRVEFVLFVAGTLWLGSLIVVARTAGGLTWGWFWRFTLVIAAIAGPMVLLPDVELIRKRRLPLSGMVGTDLVMLLAALLYLVAFASLFALMELFW